ncbi:FMNH2-dependent monooxygenase [Streptomyces sp. NPDC052040]|uniref:FMNH2-dependent monooxygenase n=1 Tax=unclassified Streptomyces TaxID=2593676 RepID=UPI0037D18E71
MTSWHGRGMLHLAAAVDVRVARDSGAAVELIRLAERGALDFVTLGDGLAEGGSGEFGGGSGGSGDGSAGPGAAWEGCAAPGSDALGVLLRAASATGRIGLVADLADLAVGRGGPLPVPAAVEALDRVSRGRAGWRYRETGGPGGTPPLPSVPRQLPYGMTEERERVPARGHPVRVVDATDPGARRAAGRHADVALVRAESLAAAVAARTELLHAAAESGRNPGSLRVLAALIVDLGEGECAAEPGWGGLRPRAARGRGGAVGGSRRTGCGPLYRGGPVDLAELIAAWHETGAVDGFHLTPVEPRRDLERLVNGTVALLQHRGRFRTFYPGSTLGEHLGITGTGRRPRPSTVTGGTP